MGAPDFKLELLNTWQPKDPPVLSHSGPSGAAPVLRRKTGFLEVGVACPQLSSLPQMPRTPLTLGAENMGLYEPSGSYGSASLSHCLISF